VKALKHPLLGRAMGLILGAVFVYASLDKIGLGVAVGVGTAFAAHTALHVVRQNAAHKKAQQNEKSDKTEEGEGE